MRLILIRHGESQGNVDKVIYGKTDYGLTQKGMDQSEMVSLGLKEAKIDAIISSPLKRAQHLAQLIAQDHSLKVRTEECISEMNYGLFEGLKPHEAEDQYGDFYRRYLNDYETYTIPEGEGYFQFRERVQDFLRTMIAKEGTFIVVTHSGVIRECLIYLLDLTPSQVWHFKIEPACQIQISYADSYGILEEIKVCKCSLN